jgi:hypothetical protein
MPYLSTNRRIVEALDVLDALYFLLQSSHVNQKRLDFIRASFVEAPHNIRIRLLQELKDEIAWLRRESGVIAKNSDYVSFYSEIREGGARGHALVPKWDIDQRWFSKFGRVIARWPYVKDHAMVLYDPCDLQVRNRLFELEGSLYRDAEVLIEQAKAHHKGVDDFRKREKQDHFLLHTYLNTAATVLFHFLEAYLNGLAFDCLLNYHNKLTEDEHNTLTEWDSTRNSRRFIPTDKKIFRYPVLVSKCHEVDLDLSGCRAAHYLANDAKELRDALTHPSPHLDPRTQTLHKIGLIATLSMATVQSIFDAGRDYVLTVEKALFGRPEDTVPWLFPKAAIDKESETGISPPSGSPPDSTPSPRTR